MLSRFIAMLMLACLPLSASADQLIIEPEMGRDPIIKLLNSSQHTVDLVMYGFTDERLLNTLLQQNKNGKTVNVILERSPFRADGENNKTIQLFDINHIHWQGSIPPFHLIHQKTLLIDDKQALVMTFNFTHSSFKTERNFALLIDDPKRVSEISSVFSADWNHKPIDVHARDLIWSPDNSRNKLISLINHAQHSIDIYSQNINDYKLVGALAKAARNGVTVKILTSANINTKQANYLARAGVTIHQSKQLYIHAKALIIDDNVVVIGSINLTHQSLDDNRELSVVSNDTDVVKRLTATFDKDWNNTNGGFAQHVHYNKRAFTRAMKLLYKTVTAQ